MQIVLLPPAVLAQKVNSKPRHSGLVRRLIKAPLER